ncbi:MAG: putative bifunctional diguanylate cyclase/phosphodiesterase, partial [Hyphomonadaceae bacterium]
MSEQIAPAAYRNDLTRLMLIISGGLVFFAAVLIAVIVYSGVSANRAAVERERQLVENALDRSVIRVLSEQKSVAFWDDAVAAVSLHGLDTAWIDVQYGAYLNETYGHDEIFIVNDKDAPVYAYVEGARVDPTEAYARHQRAFDAIVAEARRDARSGLRTRDYGFEADQENYRELLGARLARWTGHILSLDGTPAIVSAITIVPNLDATLLRGTPYMLVSVVRIDNGFLHDIGKSLLLPDLTLSAHPGRGGALASEDFVADDGSPLGYMTWTTRRPGQRIIVFILPLVALGIVGAGMFVAHMLRRLKRASTALTTREARSRYEAQHDALSGLANRQHFSDTLGAQLLQSAARLEGVAVAYADVDRFKDVNDTLGHHAGDELIKAVAERLQTFVAPTDFLARFGGDEFAVMRAPATMEDDHDLAERLREAFAEPFEIYGQPIRMTASFGLARAPDHGATPEALMRNADIALYEAKKNGRDRATFFNANMAWDLERRRGIELALREAIEADNLRLHYQPLVSAVTGRITSVEALLRWRHPTRGDISPGVFVPIAEEAGLMPALGAWVLERALRDSKLWPDMQVAINLSPVQFRHVDLVSMLRDMTAKYDVDPRNIVLEITEGVLLESTERTRSTIETLRGMGFKTALDDFGTGYSSMCYLCDFKFDKIKIDRSFVQGISAAQRSMTV